MTTAAHGVRLGIDLGGSKILGALIKDGKVIASVKKRTKAQGGYEAVLERIVSVAQKVCEEGHVDLGSLERIGVGVPSPVVDNRLIHAPNLGWRDAPLADDLASRTGVAEINLANDVNCGALGEAALGAGRGYESVFAMFLGTGLGGGWVHGGRVHDGTSGFAGEVGHLMIPGENALCGCGQRGCLETVASKKGLARIIADAVAAGVKTELESSDKLRSSEVEKAYRKGCKVAVPAVEAMGHHLGWAMNTIATVINPQLFVIGGGVGERLGKDLIPLIDAARTEAPFILRNGPYEVRVGELGGDAVAIGAAQLGFAGEQ